MNLGTRLVLFIVWLLHFLPARVIFALGRGLGALAYRLAGRRRRVAERNVALCLPALSPTQQQALVRENFALLGRSILERSLLWHASPARLRSLITVEGDVGLADRLFAESKRSVMWLLPHFMALEAAGLAIQLFQTRRGGVIYQAQSNPVFDAAMRRGRERFGASVLFSRHDGARQLVRAVREDHLSMANLPDMDFGLANAAFVPFFGVQAATLTAPSGMARLLNLAVQPVVAKMTPSGWHVSFGEAWTDWPTPDAAADAASMNRWIEAHVRADPTQYLWVHKRFKTRPPGEASVY